MRKVVEAILDEVRMLVAEQLPDVDKSSITMASRFAEDLRADSLALVELVQALEEKFSKRVIARYGKQEIPQEVAQELKTVGHVVLFIEALPES